MFAPKKVKFKREKSTFLPLLFFGNTGDQKPRSTLPLSYIPGPLHYLF